MPGPLFLLGITGGGALTGGTVVGSSTWYVKVDWDANGNFTGTYDDISEDALSIAIQGGRSVATDGFAAASATVEVENPTGKYSRFNPGSPIYGLLLPDRELLIQAVHLGITYPQFRGKLVDVEEGVSIEGIPTVRLSFVDAFDRLSRGTVRTPLYEGMRVDQLITNVLDLAGWSATLRSLEAARATLDRYWAHNLSPLEAIQSAAKQELGGQMYIDRAGQVKFENRDHRTLRASSGTVSDMGELRLGFRRDDLIDRVRFTRAGLSQDTALTVVYDLSPAGRRLEPGSASPVNVIRGEFAEAGKDAVQPVAVTDFTATANQDGTGADKTAQVSIVSWTVYGGGFEAVIANADSAPAYLQRFDVRAKATMRSNEERSIEVVATAPLVTQQVIEDEFAYSDDAAGIRSLATWRLATFSTDQPRPVVELLAHTDAELAIALAVDVSMKLRIQNTTGLYPSQLDGDFFVEGYEVEVAIGDENMRVGATLFSAEQAIGTMFRISGAAGAGADYSTIQNAAAVVGDRIGW